MRRFTLVAVLPVVVLFAGCSQTAEAPRETAATTTPAAGPVAPPTSDAEMIASAISAAPDAVSGAATVVTMDEKGQMRTLRAGTNGWTCMPDMPTSPGADPMCLDANGMAWAHAWMSRTTPPAGKMGFGYMLRGGSDASNDDPFATGPAPGGAWVDTGPHVMIFNVGDQFDGYPTTAANPKAPYVMWSGTPYRHLMIPVE